MPHGSASTRPTVHVGNCTEEGLLEPDSVSHAACVQDEPHHQERRQVPQVAMTARSVSMQLCV